MISYIVYAPTITNLQNHFSIELLLLCFVVSLALLLLCRSVNTLVLGTYPHPKKCHNFKDNNYYQTLINLFYALICSHLQDSYHNVFGYMEYIYNAHERFWTYTLEPCLEKVCVCVCMC